MHGRPFRMFPFAVALALLPSMPCPAQDSPPEGFTALFNGKDLNGFGFVLRGDGVDPGKTWSVRDGVIICTGEPSGYFHTKGSYRNFVVRFEWKFARPENLEDDRRFTGNTGLLLRIQGDHKVWPMSVEVQGAYRDHGKIFGLGMDVKHVKFDKEAQKKAQKPVGEWNVTEVTSKGDQITATLNGVAICTASCPLTEGPLGWQSEGAEVHFKNIYIKEIE